MSMTCNSCGNSNAYHIRSAWDGGKLVDFCDSASCGNLDMAGAGIPDVYLPRGGMKFENLCDDMGRPYEISSKREKAEIMRRLGISEVGDRVNGAPYAPKDWIEGTRESRRKSFEKDRPVIRDVYSRYLQNVKRRNA
jgi:hypothetical protein